jgi:5-methylcytosine-specific restriction protein A
MLPDPQRFARLVTAETGLPLEGTRGRHGQQEQIELVPADHKVSQTFRICSRLGWRSVDVSFEPGAYAGDLLAAMHEAPLESRKICESVLAASIADGAEIRLTLDGVAHTFPGVDLWNAKWKVFSAQLSRGQLDINSGDAQADLQQLVKWTGRLAAALFALMPLQAEEEPDGQLTGYPEGAKTTVTVNRYERDRRNRAAALAIHGYRCKGCDHLMSEEYGDVAATLVEVHHVTPVHALGAGYMVNPETDLVPLCPNCHSVAHTRNPPLSIREIRAARRSGHP